MVYNSSIIKLKHEAKNLDCITLKTRLKTFLRFKKRGGLKFLYMCSDRPYKIPQKPKKSLKKFKKTIDFFNQLCYNGITIKM